MGLRGTEVTMFDFAFYGKKIYNWDIQVLYNKNDERNDSTVIQKFSNEFDLHYVEADRHDHYEFNKSIESFLDKHPSEYFYLQKGGQNDGLCPSNSKSCILCCAIVDPEKERHGHRYAFISDWLSNHCSGGKTPVVPSIVDLPDIQTNLREELGIPLGATVFGRTGGMDTWNIPFTNEVVKRVCEIDDNTFFVFQNTPRFFDHKNIIYLDTTADLKRKVEFINTCDALLHSRLEGESFGLTCGEFSLRNKPVITFFDSPERNHIEILKDKGVYYQNGQQLLDILLLFKKQIANRHADWNCYRHFSPEKVMPLFKDKFLN